MKKFALCILAAMSTSLGFAQKTQEKNVPVLVLKNFKTAFPVAKKVTWEKEGNLFEAEFELNETEQSVLLDSLGQILETEIEIQLSQVPANVLDYVKLNYKGQKVKEADKIMNAQGLVTYEIEMKGKDLIFDGGGNFIKEILN